MAIPEEVVDWSSVLDSEGAQAVLPAAALPPAQSELPSPRVVRVSKQIIIS